MPRFILLAIITLAPAVVAAQHEHTHESGSAESPYVSLMDRTIKALSPAEIDDLMAGNGMGFALPAELNGFPGPKHALELADELKLSDTQKAETQALFERMQAKAKDLGSRLIEAETHLDVAFASKTIDQAKLAQMTGHIGQIRGDLRATHLAAHLDMMEILTEAQIHAYNMARGYHAGH